MRFLRLLRLGGFLGIVGVLGPVGSAPAPAPPIRPTVPAPAGPARKFPRLALTTYYYWFQADPRKSVPAAHVRRPGGGSLLVDHPWDGAGPWFSYERVQWHKNQLTMIRDTGIDVVLPVFAGGEEDPYRVRGLDCLAQALKEIRTEGRQPFHKERGYPLVGMWLDLSAVREALGAPVDLKTEPGRRALYAAIATFYRHIPPEFRAEVQVPAEAPRRTGREGPGRGRTHLVVVTGAAALKAWDEGALAFCGQRFAQEFHAGLVWIGGGDLRGKARGCDGYLKSSDPAVAEAADPTEGWLKVGSVGPVDRRSDLPASGAAATEREGGQKLIQSFLAALRAGPDWVVVDSWNQFQAGTEVAPSLELGLQPRDLTDAGVTQFKGTGEYGAAILTATVPEALVPRTLYQVEALVENTGLKVWGAQNRAGLSYRWYQDGKPVGDAGPLVAAPSLAPGEAKVFSIGLTSPMQGVKPLPDGRYELRLDMMVPPDQWFAGPESAAFSTSVEIGKAPALQPTWLGTDLPAMMKAGATYSATLRLRNDGTEIWHKTRGAAVGYRWRRVGPARGAGAPDVDEPINAKMTPVLLPADVPPGAILPVPITVKLVDDKGASLAISNPRESWSYELEWGFFDGAKWLAASDDPGYRECVSVLAMDPGPSFIGAGLPTDLEAGQSLVTKVGVRNTGPETWRLADTKLGYHWYYFDGTEAVWSAGTAALPRDVLAGETVIVPDVAVHVPDYNGPMYLVFDLQVGGTYVSSTAGSRGGDLLVLSTMISGGRHLPLDLTPILDTDGISTVGNRADGDLDGKGGTLPAELLPPYVLRPPLGTVPQQTNLYPCGLWDRPVGMKSSPQGPVTDAVTFRYPDKRERAMNVVSCAGQRIQLATGPVTAIHLLGCATGADASGSFTIVFKDGTSVQQPVTMSLWTAPPNHGEHVAFAAPQRHTSQGEDPPGGAYLNHYTLYLEGARPIAAIVLPQNRAMKVLAITVEALAQPSSPAGPPSRIRLPANLIPK